MICKCVQYMLLLYFNQHVDSSEADSRSTRMVSIRAISALALAHQAAAFATPGRQFASRMATVPSASFYELQDTDTTGAPVDFKQVRS